MATVGTNNADLVDFSRRQDTAGNITPIVELMTSRDEFMNDFHYMQCNDGTTHNTTVRTGLPSGTWRRMYQGIQSTKSTTAQVTDSTGMLEALPKIDVDVIDKQEDPAAAMLSEHTPHLDGLSADIATQLIYGDTATEPDRFMGLAPRYNTLDTGDDTLSSYNVFDGGGAGADNTSIWLLTWGPEALSMIYPKGAMAGLKHEDLGRQLTTASGGGDFLAYVNHYKWDLGASVKDWRTCGRIANIDISNLEASSSAADLVELMIRLSERLRGKGGRRTWVMHERVRTMLRIQIKDTSNVNLTFDTVEGHEVMKFDGVPLRISDSLSMAETLLT
jgi:hypothetical protein